MASPSPTPTNVVQIIEGMLNPGNGNGTVQAEIACCGLPFGGLGVLSHALTYYTITCLMFGVAPVKWWSKNWDILRAKGRWIGLVHYRLNLMYAVATLLLTFSMAAVTMHKCRNAWPLVCMAFWKLTLSVSYGLIGIIRANFTSKEQKKEREQQKFRHDDESIKLVPGADPSTLEALPLQSHSDAEFLAAEEQSLLQGIKADTKGWVAQWIWAHVVEQLFPPDRILSVRAQMRKLLKFVERIFRELRNASATALGLLVYLPGTVVGLVGLIGIIVETWHINHDVQVLTYAMIGSIVLLFLLTVRFHINLLAAMTITFTTVCAVAVFFSDLILAAVRGEWLGVPSGADPTIQVAYWLYYVGKRLHMLSC